MIRLCALGLLAAGFGLLPAVAGAQPLPGRPVYRDPVERRMAPLPGRPAPSVSERRAERLLRVPAAVARPYLDSRPDDEPEDRPRRRYGRPLETGPEPDDYEPAPAPRGYAPPPRRRAYAEPAYPAPAYRERAYREPVYKDRPYGPPPRVRPHPAKLHHAPRPAYAPAWYPAPRPRVASFHAAPAYPVSAPLYSYGYPVRRYSTDSYIMPAYAPPLTAAPAYAAPYYNRPTCSCY